MGITIYSYPHALNRRISKSRKRVIGGPPRRRLPSKFTGPTQDDLEERLNELQERIYSTRQYIRAIRHEYSGSAREAIEYYLPIIDDIYSRVATYYIRNIREDFPVFESFLAQIDAEYTEFITEGGFTEEEAYDYIYGNESRIPDVPAPSDAEEEADEADGEVDYAAMEALEALVIT